MKITLFIFIIAIILLSGCASVPMESYEKSNIAKEFKSPASDSAGVYLYRNNSIVGSALKKDLWIDEDCIGETARGVFFYHEVEGDRDHIIYTESEFSPNSLKINTKSGELYFVRQYIKAGLFVGGAGLEKKNFEVGKKEVLKLEMAKKGTCS